jgi:hypothetical protein
MLQACLRVLVLKVFVLLIDVVLTCELHISFIKLRIVSFHQHINAMLLM